VNDHKVVLKTTERLEVEPKHLSESSDMKSSRMTCWLNLELSFFFSRLLLNFFPGNDHYGDDYSYHECEDDQIPEVQANRVLQTSSEEYSRDDEYYSTVKQASCSNSCAEELNAFRTPFLGDLEDTTEHRTDCQ